MAVPIVPRTIHGANGNLYLKSQDEHRVVYSEERPELGIDGLRAFYSEVYIEHVQAPNGKTFWRFQPVAGNRMSARPESESRIAQGAPDYFLTLEDAINLEKPLSERRLMKLAGITGDR